MRFTLLTLFVLALLKAGLFSQEAKHIKIHAIDETGIPVANAKAEIAFVLGSDADDHVGLTDVNGIFSAHGNPLVGVYLEVSKGGYYTAHLDNTRSDPLPPGNNVEITFTLPHVLRPTGLYANFSYDAVRGHALRIPVQNEWIGYDFEVSDWVAPYGKGKTTDIRFRFSNAFRGYSDYIKNLDDAMAQAKRAYAARHEEWTEEKFKITAGKWDAILEISFPDEQEGIREETDQFLAYSQLKMPHEAPVDGYQPTWRYSINSYSPTTLRDNAGFFLRTRVKVDKSGKIVSANYAKIMGDFHFSPANGGIRFQYYFNPVPNDRNLEFDPKKNLFSAGFPGANVNDP
jgi:hypothetical protein